MIRLTTKGNPGRPGVDRRAIEGRRLARVAAAVLALLTGSGPLAAQERPGVLHLTLERMVDLALSSSYQVRQLNMNVDRTRAQLRAEQARLKSRVEVDVTAPAFQNISATQWNSTLQRNEIIRENSRRWEAELSIEQPVILFGYPTNGYLSLNNRVYRLLQVDEEGVRDVNHYNQYFIEYRQPLFQPNELRNNIEEAGLDLEESELDFHGDVVEIVNDVSEDYLELFDIAYGRVINAILVANLERAESATMELLTRDPSRSIALDQIRVELANAREQVQGSASDFRLRSANIKQRLQIPEADSIVLNPVIAVRPVPIDAERAMEYATTLTPRFRQIDIQFRQNEIELENTKGEDAFRLDLEFSYGREMQDPVFRSIWNRPENTYTIDVNASIPLWDWGERDARIAARQISLDQTRLRLEEAQTQVVSNVRNEVRNVTELENRALAMAQNLELAAGISRTSLDRYREGTITVLDLLQSFRRETDTANNLLDAHRGWRRALLRLQELTFYDFEAGVPVLERFGIVTGTRGQG